MAARRRLSDDTVLWIRKMHARPYPDGSMPTNAAIAKAAGCSVTHVRDIVAGRRRHDRCTSSTRRGNP